jgi:hypothetical protein
MFVFFRVHSIKAGPADRPRWLGVGVVGELRRPIASIRVLPSLLTVLKFNV